MYSSLRRPLLSTPDSTGNLQATIAGGGVIPHIHKSLINKATKLDQKVCDLDHVQK